MYLTVVSCIIIFLPPFAFWGRKNKVKWLSKIQFLWTSSAVGVFVTIIEDILILSQPLSLDLLGSIHGILPKLRIFFKRYAYQFMVNILSTHLGVGGVALSLSCVSPL